MLVGFVRMMRHVSFSFKGLIFNFIYCKYVSESFRKKIQQLKIKPLESF